MPKGWFYWDNSEGGDLPSIFLVNLSLFRASMLQIVVAFMCNYSTERAHKRTRAHTCTRAHTHTHYRAHTPHTTHNHTQVCTAFFPLKHCFGNILMKYVCRSKHNAPVDMQRLQICWHAHGLNKSVPYWLVHTRIWVQQFTGMVCL